MIRCCKSIKSWLRSHPEGFLDYVCLWKRIWITLHLHLYLSQHPALCWARIVLFPPPYERLFDFIFDHTCHGHTTPLLVDGFSKPVTFSPFPVYLDSPPQLFFLRQERRTRVQAWDRSVPRVLWWGCLVFSVTQSDWRELSPSHAASDASLTGLGDPH